VRWKAQVSELGVLIDFFCHTSSVLAQQQHHDVLESRTCHALESKIHRALESLHSPRRMTHKRARKTLTLRALDAAHLPPLHKKPHIPQTVSPPACGLHPYSQRAAASLSNSKIFSTPAAWPFVTLKTHNRSEAAERANAARQH